jgi:hypothetical protein
MATRVPLGHATIVGIVAGFGDGGQPPRSDARPTSKVLVSMPIGAPHGHTLAHTSCRHSALTRASPPCPPQDSWSDCVSSKTGRAGLGRAGSWSIVDIPPPHHRSAQPVRQGTCLSTDAGRESSCICFCISPGQRGPLALFSEPKEAARQGRLRMKMDQDQACVSCVVLRWSPKSQDAWPAMLGYRYPPPADQGGRPGRCKLDMAVSFTFHSGMCPRFPSSWQDTSSAHPPPRSPNPFFSRAPSSSHLRRRSVSGVESVSSTTPSSTPLSLPTPSHIPQSVPDRPPVAWPPRPSRPIPTTPRDPKPPADPILYHSVA